MYIPKHFQCNDKDRLFAFMEAYSFATVISQVGNKPFGTHVPLLVDKENNSLIGHVAKANPHWEHLDGSENVLCIFNGPHSYVSPQWYVNPKNVPTWNYVAVHVYGKIETITDSGSLDNILRRTTEIYEKEIGTSWSYDSVAEHKNKLFNAIVGLRLNITSIEGKVKMSQNRSQEDAKGASDGLKSVGANDVATLVDTFCKL